MSFRLTREQLYDLVWSEAMQKLGRQIGISDVALAKHCRNHNIPVPERGYWNKLSAGKKVTRKPLPLRDLGSIDRIEISGKLTSDLLARIKGEPGVPNPEEVSLDLLTERFRRRLGSVSVPRSFARAHPLIAKLLAKDEAHRQRKLAEPFYWREPQFDTPFERRRLRVLNGLFLAFEKVGCGGWVRGEQARELSLSIGGKHMGFTLDRPSSRRGGGRPASSGDTNDKLCLELASYEPPAGVRLLWADENGSTLEDQFTEMIVGIAVAAEQLQRAGIARQIAWERQQREEAERQAFKRKIEEERRERERLAALEQAKVDRLREQTEAWFSSANIRTFVAAALASVSGTDDSASAEAWASWALEVADGMDPLTSGSVVEFIRTFRASDDQDLIAPEVGEEEEDC